jgi:hypothetical protein
MVPFVTPDRIFLVHPDPATNSILTEILLPCQDMIASLLHGLSGTVLPWISDTGGMPAVRARILAFRDAGFFPPCPSFPRSTLNREGVGFPGRTSLASLPDKHRVRLRTGTRTRGEQSYPRVSRRGAREPCGVRLVQISRTRWLACIPSAVTGMPIRDQTPASP